MLVMGTSPVALRRTHFPTSCADATPVRWPVKAMTEIGDFLDDLGQAGFRPDEIDFVLCTHLHFDPRTAFRPPRAPSRAMDAGPRAR